MGTLSWPTHANRNTLVTSSSKESPATKAVSAVSAVSAAAAAAKAAAGGASGGGASGGGGSAWTGCCGSSCGSGGIGAGVVGGEGTSMKRLMSSIDSFCMPGGGSNAVVASDTAHADVTAKADSIDGADSSCADADDADIDATCAGVAAGSSTDANADLFGLPAPPAAAAYREPKSASAMLGCANLGRCGRGFCWSGA
eukprot:495809-Pleurochrysis_carterae.AAC.2